MPLSTKALEAIPEIAVWLEETGHSIKQKTTASGLYVAANLLRRETAKLNLEDTTDLYDSATTGSFTTWQWATRGMVRFTAADQPDGPYKDWAVMITETSTGAEAELTHTKMVKALHYLRDNRVKLTSGDNPVMQHEDMDVVEAVLDARDRDELDLALRDCYAYLVVIVIQFALFGEYRYPQPR